MITITKQYRLTGSTSSSHVTYTWSSGDSCASVSPVTATVPTGEVVEFDFTFTNEACFDTTFTLSVYDNVCPTPVEYQYSYSSPCPTVNLSVSNTPDRGNPFVFTANTSGGTAPYSYEWNYNDALFEVVRQVGSTIAFQLKNVPVIPSSTIITATVTDVNGCTKEVDYTYNICQPVAQNASATSICVTPITVNGTSYNSWAGGIQLFTSECSGTTIDWDTVELNYDTTSLFVQTNVNVMTVYSNSTTTTDTYTIGYTVKNNNGVTSTEGTVTVVVPTCSVSELNSGPSIPLATSKRFSSGATSGDTVELDLNNLIIA